MTGLDRTDVEAGQTRRSGKVCSADSGTPETVSRTLVAGGLAIRKASLGEPSYPRFPF